MTGRNLLLYAYPRSWREEYGEELAGILATRRLTARLVADVVTSGARQHLRHDDPWKLCGAGLALWILMAGPLWDAFGVWYVLAGFMIVSAAAALTVVRRRTGVWKATAASAKAAIVGQYAITTLYLNDLIRWGSEYLRHRLFMWGETVVFTMAISTVFGFAGAVTAYWIGRARRPRTI
jgi:hypothetical protein